jgi:hypothetical protein
MYRGRNILHLQSCKEKYAEWIAQKERRQARSPLPSPDYFTPDSTPDPTSIAGPSVPRSPTLEPSIREPSVARDVHQDEEPENVVVPDIVPQQLEDAFHEPPALPAGNVNHGKSSIIFCDG